MFPHWSLVLSTFNLVRNSLARHEVPCNSTYERARKSLAEPVAEREDVLQAGQERVENRAFEGEVVTWWKPMRVSRRGDELVSWASGKVTTWKSLSAV